MIATGVGKLTLTVFEMATRWRILWNTLGVTTLKELSNLPSDESDVEVD